MQLMHDAPDLVAAITLAGFTGGCDKALSSGHAKTSKTKNGTICSLNNPCRWHNIRCSPKPRQQLLRARAELRQTSVRAG